VAPTAENLHEYFAAGAVAVGVGREVFAPGFTLDTIVDASKRIREAVEAARPD
jgi:2-keto-3-deoxy-6-phosphogluconate aldolase